MTQDQHPIEALGDLIEEIGEHRERLAAIDIEQLAAPQEIADTVMPLLFDLAQATADLAEAMADDLESLVAEMDEPDSQLSSEDASLFRKHLLWIRETIQAAQAAYVDENEQGRVALAEMDTHLKSVKTALDRIDEIELRDEEDRPPAPVLQLHTSPPAPAEPAAPPPADPSPPEPAEPGAEPPSVQT